MFCGCLKQHTGERLAAVTELPVRFPAFRVMWTVIPGIHPRPFCGKQCIDMAVKPLQVSFRIKSPGNTGLIGQHHNQKTGMVQHADRFHSAWYELKILRTVQIVFSKFKVPSRSRKTAGLGVSKRFEFDKLHSNPVKRRSFQYRSHARKPFMIKTNNLKITAITPIIAPADLRQVFPMTEHAREFVSRSREKIKDIIQRRDRRLMVVVGPCSIHDPDAAVEYARRLADLSRRIDDQLFLVMRVYFEKPRTTVGWKGLINDPDMNGTHQIPKGWVLPGDCSAP